MGKNVLGRAAEKMTKWVGGGLWFLFLALWVRTLSREPESSQWPERAEQAAGGSIVGTLVKYPGWGGAEYKRLQPKATGWLLHQQQRWTERAKGPGARLLRLECLPPVGLGNSHQC